VRYSPAAYLQAVSDILEIVVNTKPNTDFECVYASAKDTASSVTDTLLGDVAALGNCRFMSSSSPPTRQNKWTRGMTSRKIQRAAVDRYIHLNPVKISMEVCGK
jgi:hypothetical protein